LLSLEQRAENELQLTTKFNSILSLYLINDTNYYRRKVLAEKIVPREPEQHRPKKP